ncbi:MAG: response regulator [Candidatus Omnitrophica bacterium]|jgi:two-component system chemotaxis response regulator CheY|nr:response regulator [Candidatus Omnitrophota bacterium]MDD5655514.1 response regulator [Candidatus Omnitrophota bacterium]
MARIMVTDDAIFMRQMLSNILKAEGYEICGEASNAKEAVEKYQQLKPDLVTMDIVMPMMEELDGIGAVKEILKFDPGAKILIISVMGQESLVTKALDAGAKDFIIKPFKSERVIEVVKGILK